MNENPGGTPNPLNPSPEPIATPGAVRPNPPEATPAPAPASVPTPRTSRPINRTMGVRPSVPGHPMGRPTQTPQANPRIPVNRGPISSSMQTTPITPSEPASTIANVPPEPSTDPAPVSEVVEPKKTKTGVVVGLIISLFIAVGCAVAAILFFMNPSGKDAVSLAMNKLVVGEAPSNVKMNGNIDIKLNNPAYPISELKVDFDSEMKTGTPTNSSKASIYFLTLDNEEFSFDVNEIYASNGDLYLKMEGWEDLIGGMSNMINKQSAIVTDCASGEADCESVSSIEECDEEGNCSTVEITTNSSESITGIDEAISVVNTLDGEWLRISADELDQFYGESLGESPIGCVVDSMNSISTNSNSLMELYNKNPFVVSSTDNVSIKSSGNPIYRIMVNNEEFANFTNSVKNTNLLGDFTSCLGLDETTINTNILSGTISETPDIFVEIDKNDNFARLYVRAEVSEGDDNKPNSLDGDVTEAECDDCKHKILLTADINFSYPDNINITEPVEYRDFFEVIDEIFSQTSATEVENS